MDLAFGTVRTHIIDLVPGTNSTITGTYTPDSYDSDPGDGITEVRLGARAEFLVAPDNDFAISAVSLTVNGSPANFNSIQKQASGNWLCTVNSVSGNITVTSTASAAYGITLSPSAGGSTTVLPANRAFDGESVAITTIPNSGYRVSGLSVTAADSSTVETTPAGTNGYTFTMPAKAVTISVSYSVITYTVQVSAGAGGRASGGGSYVPGARVTVSAAPGNNYTFSGWTLTGLDVVSSADNPYAVAPYKSVKSIDR